jgi:cell wall assembly regulator SMI1
MSTPELERSLEAIRAHAKNVVPAAAKSLRRSAGSGARKRLEKALGRRLPPELATWFAHHDGQHFLADGLDPTAPAMTWLSVKDAIAERGALIDQPEKMLPWDDRWLPILANGGGDFYVHVTAGRNAGNVLFYLHDARRRPVVAKSLAELAARIAKELAARDAPKASGLGAKLAAPLVDCGAPTLDALNRAPVGTVYYRRALPHRSFFYWLYVKVTKRSWASAYAKGKDVRDFRIDGALKRIRKEITTTSEADWRVPAADVREGLSNAKAFPKGAKKDAYFARKRGLLG